MKKLGYLIAVFAVISCKNEGPVDYTVITGKIKNNEEKTIAINGIYGLVKKIIDVAEDGSFVDTLKFEAGTYFLFDGKNKAPVYLEPGYNINIVYNASDFLNTLDFTGVGSEISTYLWDKGKKINELAGNPNTVYELEEDEYKTKFAEIKTALSEMITGAEGIPEDYKAKELRNIHYGYLNKLSIYELYHAHFAKKPDFKTSEGFLSELKDMDYNNEEDYMFSEDYKELLMAYYNDEALLIAKNDSVSKDLAYLKSAATIENETIKNELLFSIAKYLIPNTDNLEEFYKVFMAASTSEENKKVITESYTKLMKDSQ